MAKRFTDSDKWHKNKWFRRLPRDGKLFWLFLCDSCDHAGIWDVDWEDVEYCLGGEVDRPELTRLVNDRIIEVAGGEQWFLLSFIEFQYHGRLDESNRVHASIIKRLTKFGINLRLLQAPYLRKEGAKDKDKDKDTPNLIPVPDPDPDPDADAKGADPSSIDHHLTRLLCGLIRTKHGRKVSPGDEKFIMRNVVSHIRASYDDGEKRMRTLFAYYKDHDFPEGVSIQDNWGWKNHFDRLEAWYGQSPEGMMAKTNATVDRLNMRES